LLLNVLDEAPPRYLEDSMKNRGRNSFQECVLVISMSKVSKRIAVLFPVRHDLFVIFDQYAGQVRRTSNELEEIGHKRKHCFEKEHGH
jgi:hypothetical protein